jgi:hypothetical protein
MRDVRRFHEGRAVIPRQRPEYKLEPVTQTNDSAFRLRHADDAE